MYNISYNFQGLMAIETKDWDAHDGRIAHLYKITNAAGARLVLSDFGATAVQMVMPSPDGVLADVRCCQTDSNQSQFVAKCRHLCRTKLTPLSESSGAVGLEIVSAVE